MMDLRAITHAFAPGVSVECRMEGDTFEMEDQRNWTDASYKTYVRPLALPWPYTLAKGTVIEQAVRLSVHGTPAAGPGATARWWCALARRPAPCRRSAPASLPMTSAAVTQNRAVLEKLKLKHLICHHDRRKGHDAASLAAAAAAGRAIGATPWLEAVISDIEGYEAEIAALAAAARARTTRFRWCCCRPPPTSNASFPARHGRHARPRGSSSTAPAGIFPRPGSAAACSASSPSSTASGRRSIISIS